MWAIENGALISMFGEAVSRLEDANNHTHASRRCGILKMLDDAVPGMWKGKLCVLVILQARRSVDRDTEIR